MLSKRWPLLSPLEVNPLFFQVPSYSHFKRLVDFLLALVLIVATAPLLVLACLLIKLSSNGPMLYSQVRVGRDRRLFRIYKIRTMHQNCERFSGPQWSQENDPRVTPVGRFLRGTHLDELPQLWNVLLGDMSLIGPRPERPEFVEQLEKAIPRYAERLGVRPGISGLAQVNLPPDSDLDGVRLKLFYDLHYIENLSPSLDLRLHLSTALFMLGLPFGVSTILLALRPLEGKQAPLEPTRTTADF